MKKLFFLAVITAFATVATATAQRTESYVEVSGYAERNITPDTFYLTIVITEKDSKGKISVESQQREMLKALKALGIDTDKQLTMANMSGEYFTKKKDTLLTAQYRLKLTSAADVRKVYAALSDTGISSVSMRSVSYSKIGEVRNEVRVEAMLNARDKASMLAEAIGQSIGDCIQINDYSHDAAEESVTSYSMRAMKLDAGNADADIFDEEESLEFRPIKVTSRLNARFILRGSDGKPISE